ncbi:MAG: hypothetical protein GH144_02625 [Clostridia bacterium]|nr:hypothetical protein [Clostridia bacterium]
MPYHVRQKHFWEGGPDKFVKEFFPLSPYEKNLGLSESGELSDLESQRLHDLELEESLAETASQAATDRQEERGEITADELREYRKEVWQRGGDLQPDVIQ